MEMDRLFKVVGSVLLSRLLSPTAPTWSPQPKVKVIENQILKNKKRKEFPADQGSFLLAFDCLSSGGQD